MRAVGGVAGKLRGHHRAGRGHETRTGTLFARPNYCTGQPSAETPLHNRNRRGIRERTHGAGWWCSEEVAGSRGQDTQTFVRKGSCGTNTPIDVASGFLGRVRVCWETIIRTQRCATRALLFPLGLACTRRRRRLVRTILQHCFLRRSITQRKFPTKLRKHFFFPRRRARGRHDGCFAPPRESTTSWNPTFP